MIREVHMFRAIPNRMMRFGQTALLKEEIAVAQKRLDEIWGRF